MSNTMKINWKPAAFIAGGALLGSAVTVGVVALAADHSVGIEGALDSCGVSRGNAQFFQGDLLGAETTQITMRQRDTETGGVSVDNQRCVLTALGMPSDLMDEALSIRTGEPFSEGRWGNLHANWVRGSHGLEIVVYSDQQ